MLRVQLSAKDLSRIRFADGPAPILEMVLMLFELRQRPPSATSAGHDWRIQVCSALPQDARPLLKLVPSSRRAIYLDVLTQDANEAFDRLHSATQSVHEDNLRRIRNMNLAPMPDWLARYLNSDPDVMHEFDQALRSFHRTFLAPRWSSVTARFHGDVTQRSTVLHQHGISALLNTLSPQLRFNGLTLEGRYPWDRHVRLAGAGLVLMPSAFWTGYPLFTWDPFDQSRYVLIYPARPSPAHIIGGRTTLDDTLAGLLGATRAAVLRTLHKPRNTSEIARCVQISKSSASEHATTLRAAGLITTNREGRAVVHRLSELGAALLSDER